MTAPITTYCDDLDALLEGKLYDERAAAFSSHLDQCRACRRAVDLADERKDG